MVTGRASQPQLDQHRKVDQHQQSSDEEHHKNSASIYVGFLPHAMRSSQDLRQLFCHFGQIESSAYKPVRCCQVVHAAPSACRCTHAMGNLCLMQSGAQVCTGKASYVLHWIATHRIGNVTDVAFCPLATFWHTMFSQLSGFI